MAAYTNLDDTGVGGAQRFYFSQIEQVHAGKTMVVTLFDPGEANASSYLRFLSPDGGTYQYARFSWTSTMAVPARTSPRSRRRLARRSSTTGS